MLRPRPLSPTLKWALYDWANSAFATTVLAGFFPVFFKSYWSQSTDPTASSFQLGVAHSVASLMMVVLAPVLGALADRRGTPQRQLAQLTFLGVSACLGLSLLPSGATLPALVLFVLGNLGFAGGNVLYDSLLIPFSTPATRERASALGYSLGYLGGGLLFALNVAMVRWPHTFGLADAALAVRVSFASVAIWWGVFALPLLRTPLPQSHARPTQWGALLSDLFLTVRRLRKLPTLSLFLVSYWMYMDGVDTVIRMAVDYGLSLGLEASHLMGALLMVQFVGFPAALAMGRLGTRFGAKGTVLWGLVFYVIAVLWAHRMSRPQEFYGIALCVGLVQGGVQALSRSLFAEMLPPSRPGEFFGLYNMVGKFAAVAGPALMGATAWATGSTRASILSVLGLFVLGGVGLWFVSPEKGRREAHAWESEA